MSKVHKNYGWLNSRPNSAKTVQEKGKCDIPGCVDHIRKLEE